MKFVERFRARDDQGNVYVVIVYQEELDAGTMGNPNATVPGLFDIRLADDSHVNRISDTEFLIVADGIKIIREP